MTYTGEIIQWAGNMSLIPTGFFPCDGRSLSTISYNALFLIIGYSFGGSGSSFNIPDCRGMFLRGTANGSSNDPDRATRIASAVGGATGDNVGSLQTSNIIAHTHTYTGLNGIDDHNFYYPGGPYMQVGYPNGNSPNYYPMDSSGGETRPENIYINFLIHY